MLFLNREKSTFYSSVNNRKFSILFKLVQFQRSHMFMLGIVFLKLTQWLSQTISMTVV